MAVSFATVTYGQVGNVGSSDPWKTDPVLSSWADQPGVALCFECHYGNNAAPRLDVSFSKRDEMKSWLDNDKHAIARRRVEPLTIDELTIEANRLVKDLNLTTLPADWLGASNALSRRICDKLNFDVTNPDGYAKFRNNCLTCHGGYRDEGDNRSFAKDGGAQPGITCNYCHQVGSNDAWVKEHAIQGEDKAWRVLPPTSKQAAGMHDLVNVGNQAATCYDCHIGNLKKNMFVTHVMYAAGHPPLPGVELQTFCASMPQHWQTESALYDSLEAKPFAGTDQYFKANFDALFPGKYTPDQTFWNTRKILVGAIAARLQMAKVMSDSATPDKWADYSLYDCAACHHELREPSFRQARGYVSAPGRPRLHEWPEAVLNVSLLIAGPGMREKVTALDDKLAKALSQTPFGEPNVVSSIALELETVLTTALTSAQNFAVGAPEARELIKRLAQSPGQDKSKVYDTDHQESRLLTYDSARQVVWAIQAIAAELESEKTPLPDPLVKKIADLGNPLVTGIETELPAGRQVFIYPENLNAELTRKAAYSPDKLAAMLAEIATDMAALR